LREHVPAGEVCNGSGACALSCQTGLVECNGTCINPDTDRAFCGAGLDCAASPGISCAPGKDCVGGTCSPDCGSPLSACNDACVDTQNDPAYCGNCSTVCASAANSVPVCATGNCGSVCAPGFSDCNGIGADGCETTGPCPTFVVCAGFIYPEKTVVPSAACTGWAATCAGSREFQVVGCYTANPPASDCPAGYTVATLMMIGQWAEAANVTRYQSGTSVCMYTGGSSLTAACGGTHAASYCWPRNALCPSACSTLCCPPTGPCSADGYQAPLLCVK
jgi:hypothetical protein